MPYGENRLQWAQLAFYPLMGVCCLKRLHLRGQNASTMDGGGRRETPQFLQSDPLVTVSFTKLSQSSGEGPGQNPSQGWGPCHGFPPFFITVALWEGRSQSPVCQLRNLSRDKAEVAKSLLAHICLVSWCPEPLTLPAAAHSQGCICLTRLPSFLLPPSLSLCSRLSVPVA